MQLTLIPEGLAKEGYAFRNYGDQNAEECEGCPVRTICFKEPPGHYVVVETRDVKHNCALHEGQMQVCVIEPAFVQTVLQSKLLKGTAATWEPIDCGYPECPNNLLCHPRMDAGKMEIVNQGGKVDCPMNYDIQKVTLNPLS